ncbi:MAG: DJ-1/PfpI family protein [Bacteroides sp.]|nr:DJ-1/PfpI family protein [Bacteroides sp.]
MKVAVLLFNNFETLDVFGPVEILGRLPETFEIEYYSLAGGSIRSTQGVSISTLRLAEITLPVDVFLIPGGKGTRQEINNPELVGWIRKIAQSSRYVLTVCTGSALLAKIKELDGKTTTSNKRAFDWVVSVREAVHWRRKARWTVDGTYYTSSGISAGMDITLAFVGDTLGKETAERVATEMEYLWNRDPERDPF